MGVAGRSHGGTISQVQLIVKVGGTCRIRNPWGATDVMLYRNGKEAGLLTGTLLVFDTVADETLILLPLGKK